MKKIKPILITVFACFIISAVAHADINITYTINTTAGRAPISPYIYGSNWGGGTDYTIRRSGGNRLTGYNWENNFSNAGADWLHHSDRYLVQNLPWAQQTIPGIMLNSFHDQALSQDQASIVTLQMAGYVSADDSGTVDLVDAAPSSRWKQVVFEKGSAFCSPYDDPDTSDGYVYMDECVNFLVNEYGNASTSTGVKFYSLDNEPALWSDGADGATHPRIHPAKPTCVEIIASSADLSSAVKNVDPYAQILGPVLYGFAAYLDFQGASDWGSEGSGYNWFIDYYLDEMEAASTSAGKRLLDVLDVHWYPEAQGDGERIVFGSPPYSQANCEARMQAPRTLWDPDYTEDSWIGQWFSSYLPLLPTLFDSIDTYYPGTKLSITEYDYGAQDHYSGGIATTDVLGIFGKYGVYIGTYWGDDTYVDAAIKMYTNYDGAGSTFGDTKVNAATTNKVAGSVYASMFDGDDDQLHLIVINKDFTQATNGSFNITSPRTFTQGRVWKFDDSSYNITEITPITSITGNSFSYSIPPLTVCHMVLEAVCPDGDISGNCQVDMEDFAILSSQWLDVPSAPSADIAPAGGDNFVDMQDLRVLAADWLAGTN